MKPPAVKREALPLVNYQRYFHEINCYQYLSFETSFVVATTPLVAAAPAPVIAAAPYAYGALPAAYPAAYPYAAAPAL